MKHKKYIPSRCADNSALPTDVRLSVRIRNYKELGVRDTNLAPEVFDDLPNSPTKSMDIDLVKQPFVDPWDMAEIHGAEVVEANVAREASEAAAAAAAAAEAAAAEAAAEAGPSGGEA